MPPTASSRLCSSRISEVVSVSPTSFMVLGGDVAPFVTRGDRGLEAAAFEPSEGRCVEVPQGLQRRRASGAPPASKRCCSAGEQAVPEQGHERGCMPCNPLHSLLCLVVSAMARWNARGLVSWNPRLSRERWEAYSVRPSLLSKCAWLRKPDPHLKIDAPEEPQKRSSNGKVIPECLTPSWSPLR